jgi:hypothetical protein
VAAACWFRDTHHVTLTPARIRQWARRGHIGVHRDGQARYDLREIEEHAGQQGLIAKR